MYDRLLQLWGPQAWWPAKTPLEVVIGAYLTQSTSWKSVERSLANLDARGLLAHGKQSIEAIHALSEEELRSLIRPSGYMTRKAASIKSFAAFLIAEYNGSLEALAAEPTAIIRAKLLALPGVGPETADAILLYAFGHPAMVVDEYLRRIVTRHGLLPEKAKYPAIQSLAVSAFAQDTPRERLTHYNEFHALIVETGKRYCGPTPKCEECPLAYDRKAAR
ncbi:endonuclease III domain-containing protein [Paracidobacterium acidisoli]|nr:helix-hairpin-helix domain-containing protein [Paracidobacterium acidisoli]